jgi:hypothetical protein
MVSINKVFVSSRHFALVLIPLCLFTSFRGRADLATVEFGRDIRPILSENCFPCHGPDGGKRKAKLRLDRMEDAFSTLPNGDIPIVPGNPEGSRLIQRVNSPDQDEIMPPVRTGKKLSSEQIGFLRRWIAEGAKWPKHWAFVAPERPPLPGVKNRQWPRNPIDYFILARLEEKGWAPGPVADTRVLLRRASLDLTGLPPTPQQLSEWLGYPDPLAMAVDELLTSPHFGERMASDWMDIARYADTHGFNNDVMRSMWRWRDWVIEAFNRNLPYNRFLTEQLAGDLLPHPGLDQLIATGFNRNHGINSEGGIIDEEYRVEYVADRVRTTSLAWLGLTMECARCHDHKFDPITQKDFFRFYAFFNNIDETGEDGRMANAAPILPAPTLQQQQTMAHYRLEMAKARDEMQHAIQTQNWTGIMFDSPGLGPHAASRTNQVMELDLGAWVPAHPVVTNLAGSNTFNARGKMDKIEGPLGLPALLFDGSAHLETKAMPNFDSGKGWALLAWVRPEGNSEAVLFSTANFDLPSSAEAYGEGLEVRLTSNRAVDVRLAHRWPGYAIQLRTRDCLHPGQWQHLIVSCDGTLHAKGLRVFLNGQECSREIVHDDLTVQIGLSRPTRLGSSADPATGRFVGALAGLGLQASPPKPEELADEAAAQYLCWAARTAPTQRNSDQEQVLEHAWLSSRNASFSAAAREFSNARSELLALEREAPSTMVMRELAIRRPTFILGRGQYDQPGEAVEPDVPGFLMPFPANVPRNRLGLAAWLTDSRQPLTARVVVNRFWQNLFGTGLVKSSENFGYQGDWPSHRALLDWLAVEFVQSGWDVKRLLRLMVTSATYRQDSRSTEDLNERDPENRLLARGPRQRLTAEMVRDQALFLSGLFRNEIGGPPVFPYQPTNLYKGIVVAADYPGTSYTESKGPDLYRRSLYTFWKRTVPQPTLSTFDAPDREVCTARRPKTNTPLQALALMNDTIQVEAARKLAERMLNQAGPEPAERVDFAFELATARKPKPDETQALCSLLDQRLTAYRTDPERARAFLSVGASSWDPKLDPAQLAAYANVASLILNLDETITRN